MAGSRFIPMKTNTLGSRTHASFILAHVKAHTFVYKYSRCDVWAKQQWPNPNDRLRAHIDCDAGEFLPEGWKFLGSGWSRMAFLGPDGVVYKVARFTNAGKPRSYNTGRKSTLDESRKEAETFKSKSEEFLRQGVRLAACRLINNSVLAMEYVPPAEDESRNIPYSDISEIERITGLSDLHSGNVWKDLDGKPTIIDYAA